MKEQTSMVPIVYGVPAQYQGLKFDKSFLPDKEQKDYGTFMEELMTTIVNDIAFYQKNMIICSRPNSGKTVWAYNLYSLITSKGFDMPPLKDVTEVRNILNSYTDKEMTQLYSDARCAVIRIPRDVQFWMFDTIGYIIERRVRSNGFTIFMFGGSEQDLKVVDKFDKLKYLRGTGAYNTVCIKSFW
jgi:hypothetical protein